MVGRRLGCCLYIVRVSLEPQAPAALLLARNITGRLRELCVHRPWTMLSRSSSRRRVASCSYAAFYRENRIIGRNTGRTTGNTRPRFSLPSRTAVILGLAACAHMSELQLDKGVVPRVRRLATSPIPFLKAQTHAVTTCVTAYNAEPARFDGQLTNIKQHEDDHACTHERA